jgi:hypothetical protein
VTFAAENGGSTGGSSLAVYYSPDDLINIQPGSVLRYSDGGAPLGINFATDTPLLQYVLGNQSTYNIDRFSSTTPSALNWLPLNPDILSGGVVTLAFAPNASSTSVLYFGGAGLSLEVSAHAVPEPTTALAPCAIAALGVAHRRQRRKRA